MRKPTIKTMPAAWTQPLAIISDRLLLISIEPPGVAAGTVGLSSACAHFSFVNDECFDVHGLAHAIASKATKPSFAEPR